MPDPVPDPVHDPSPALTSAPVRAAATLVEVFATRATDGAARAFALSHLDPAKGPVLWVQDRLTRHEAGEPYLPGLPHGLSVIRVDVAKPVDVLWVMEQALSCQTLGAVLGEVWGPAPAVDFTATKRLALRAEAQGVAAWLIRRAATPNLSAARDRWRIAAAPSLPHPDDDLAPGLPVWQAELFRTRGRSPGTWELGWDRATRSRTVVTRDMPGQPDAARLSQG